jgi:hypothetical protein
VPGSEMRQIESRKVRNLGYDTDPGGTIQFSRTP